MGRLYGALKEPYDSSSAVAREEAARAYVAALLTRFRSASSADGVLRCRADLNLIYADLVVLFS